MHKHSKNSNLLKIKAGAIRELGSIMKDIDDYSNFHLMVESIVSKYMSIDWLAMFNLSLITQQSEVATSPNLSFDLMELYPQIVDYDYIRDYTLTLREGQAGLYRDVMDLTNEKERYMVEFIKKTGDNTSHYMSLPVIKNRNEVLSFTLFRIGEENPYTKEDIQLMSDISPIITCAAKNILMLKKYDLKRVVLDQLIKFEKVCPLILDESLNPIEIPVATEAFLKKKWGDRGYRILPDQIQNWINKTIAPKGVLEPNTGPWSMKVRTPKMSLNCQAYAIYTELNRLVLFMRFEEHGATEDFSTLELVGLTPKEIEAVEYLPLGYTNKQIAMAMGIQEVTVKKHLRNIAGKLDTDNKLESLYRALSLRKELESFQMNKKTND